MYSVNNQNLGSIKGWKRCLNQVPHLLISLFPSRIPLLVASLWFIDSHGLEICLVLFLYFISYLRGCMARLYIYFLSQRLYMATPKRSNSKFRKSGICHYTCHLSSSQVVSKFLFQENIRCDMEIE